MANPLIQQGTLNRLRGSVSPVDFPGLNIINGNLGKEAISISFGGDATTTIDTLTGVVQSPEPYLIAMVKIHLLKSQFLADQWKTKMEDISLIGDLVIVTDSATFSDYNLSNSAIKTVEPVSFAGNNADYIITLSSIYYINNSLWDI